MTRFNYFGVFAAAGLMALSSHSEALEVNAPCSESGKDGFRKCSEYLGDKVVATAGAPTPALLPIDPNSKKKASPPGILTQIFQRVNTQVNGSTEGAKGYYQDNDPSSRAPDPNASGPAAKKNRDQYFGPTLCNLTGGPFNPAEALSTSNPIDHNGKSCGKPMRIKINMFDCSDAVIGSHPPRVQSAIAERDDYGSTPESDWPTLAGTLEDGLLRGGIVQATNFYYTDVTEKIRTNKTITVAPDSACNSLAENLYNIGKGVKKNMEGLTQLMTSETNAKEVQYCDADWDSDAFKSTHPDAGPLRQRAQQICAARAGIEAMFTQLSACEIFSRASASYASLLGSAEGQQAVFDTIKAQITQPIGELCRDQITKAHEGQRSCPSDESISKEVSDCVQKEYEARMPPIIKDFIQKRWPTPSASVRHNNDSKELIQYVLHSSSSQESQTPAVAWVFAGLQLFGSRRRSQRSRNRWLPSSDILALMMMIALAAWGCASGEPIDPGAGPPLEGSKSCAPLASGTFPNCTEAPVGGGGTTESLQAAAAAAGVTSQALENAEALSAEDAAVTLGGNPAQSEAATVGGTRSNGKGGAPAATSSGGGSVGTQDVRKGTKNAAGLNGSSGGGFSPSGLTTSASGGDAPSPTTNTATAEDVAYKSGSGAAAGGNSSISGGLFHDDSGADGTGVSSADFGAKDEAGIKAMGSGDPEDYFTRLGIDDNLFKIVERRYFTKQATWVSGELKMDRNVATPAAAKAKTLR